MLKITYKLLLIIMTISLAQSQPLDKKIKPEPLEDIRLKFPETSVHYLSNGIKVYLIEDERQPLLNIRLLVGGGSSYDIIENKAKPGLAELTAEMLTKGTDKLKALDIAKTLDGVGASINSSASNDYLSIYISSLNKHLDKVLNIANDIITNPNFNNEEIEKAKSQFKASIMAEKSNPSSLAGKLAALISYGENHPYSQINSEESIESIERKDLVYYHQTYFKANNISIAVSGDYKELGILNLLEKYFGTIKKAELPKIEIPETKSMPKGVYFIERPGSAQSTVRYVFNTVPYASDDYEYLNFASSIISGGFSGRLFKTLREKYAYTYSPTGGLGSNKYANVYLCGSDVRNDVTDSSITVIMEQVNDLAENVPSTEEFEAIKKYKYGSYLMAFENTDYVMSLIQNSEFKGKRLEKLESYPARLKQMKPRAVQNVARKYLNQDNAFIVVVGNKDVKEKLEKFGNIFEYDMDINPLSGKNAQYKETSITVDELLGNYSESIGSEDEVNFNSIIVNSEEEMSMQGKTFKGKTITKYQNGKYHSFSNFDIFTQEEWFDGENYFRAMNGNIEKDDPANDPMFKLEKDFFGVQKLNKLNFDCTILGEKKGQIVLESKDKDGSTLYNFNSETFLLESTEATKNTPMGMMVIKVMYNDYKKFDELNLPTEIKVLSPVMNKYSKNSYKINTEIDENDFKPNAKK